MRKVLIALLIAIPSCSKPMDRPMSDGPKDTSPKKATGTEFHSRLLEIAAEYRTFGRVDDEARWAPGLCRMPMPARARISESAHTKTHGQKLYYLFAGKRDEYLFAKSKTQPEGQVIVKESWAPVETEIDDSKSPRYARDDAGRVSPIATRDGRHYQPGEQRGLYIMFKTAPATEGTDQGWVYGTVTADGKTVTAAGRIASCMNCHTKTDNDRMFGLK